MTRKREFSQISNNKTTEGFFLLKMYSLCLFKISQSCLNVIFFPKLKDYHLLKIPADLNRSWFPRFILLPKEGIVFVQTFLFSFESSYVYVHHYVHSLFCQGLCMKYVVDLKTWLASQLLLHLTRFLSFRLLSKLDADGNLVIASLFLSGLFGRDFSAFLTLLRDPKAFLFIGNKRSRRFP